MPTSRTATRFWCSLPLLRRPRTPTTRGWIVPSPRRPRRRRNPKQRAPPDEYRLGCPGHRGRRFHRGVGDLHDLVGERYPLALGRQDQIEPGWFRHVGLFAGLRPTRHRRAARTLRYLLDYTAVPLELHCQSLLRPVSARSAHAALGVRRRRRPSCCWAWSL